MTEAAQKKSNNSFVDENHESLLDSLSALEKSLHDDWKLENFQSSTNEFICDLETHFIHEETLLAGTEYSGLENHTAEHRRIALNLRHSVSAVNSHETAADFVTQIRPEILSHELDYDQGYWSVLEQLPEHDEILISWSEDLETGNEEIDQQHRALATHINRFHSIYFDSASRVRACEELRSLHAYSKMHFDEEENQLGNNIDPDHKSQHEQLLKDLTLLISEVQDGKYGLGNISSHLKYWLLSHLRFYDIPAFRKPR